MMSLRLPPFIALRGAALVFLAVLSAASGGPAFTQINGPVNAQAPAQQAPAAQTPAKDSPDERRCTGQWRASNDERITACTVLIDSGRYQAANLAILRHDRGVASR